MIDGLKARHRTAIIDILAANERVELAVLFGSRAMQTHTPTSDIDIALFGDNLTLTDQANLAAAIDDLPMAQRADLVLYKTLDNSALCEHIERHGVEWYRKLQGTTNTGLHLAPKHCRLLENLVQEHLPGNKVRVYGSRVSGCGYDNGSLDLVLHESELNEIPIDSLIEFENAVRDSNIPFQVKVRDWAKLSESFHRKIEREYMVIVGGAGNGTGPRDLAPRLPVSYGSSRILGEAPNASVNRSWLYHPTFPENWEKQPLHSMARWVNGIAFKNIQFSETGWPVIKISEIKGGISGQTKFTQQTFDESVHIQEGDMLFSWSGQPETSINVFWWHGPEGWLNQHVFKVTPEDRIDSVFFYYLLRYLKPNFVGIARNKQTTGLGHVTKRDLESLEVACPELPEQRTIAHILGTLDDKIDLNRRMNSMLEAMARAIFKDWFVDFGPTRAKAEGRDPYLASEIWDLFPDKLDDEGKPKGWSEFFLKELGKVITGKTPSTKNLKYFGNDMPFLKIPDMHKKLYVLKTSSTLSHDGAISQSKKTLPSGSISVSCIATPGLVVLNHRETQTNQQINSLVPSDPDQSLFLFWLCRQLAADVILGGSGGSVFHNMNKTSFENIKLVFPGNLLARYFSITVSPLHEHILSNEYENEVLAQIRDLLLPKFMSGEIRVSDAEKLVGEIA